MKVLFLCFGGEFDIVITMFQCRDGLVHALDLSQTRAVVSAGLVQRRRLDSCSDVSWTRTLARAGVCRHSFSAEGVSIKLKLRGSPVFQSPVRCCSKLLASSFTAQYLGARDEGVN